MLSPNYQPVLQSNDAKFNTLSGKVVNLRRPDADMICIEDIANALGNICRYGGHLPIHYSVAQHSLIVMALAPESIKLEALLHDAAEAYLGDVIKPLKNMIGSGYIGIEYNFEKVICEKYNLNINLLDLVKPHDLIALELEFNYFYKGDQALVNISNEFLGSDITKWNMPYTRSAFISHFKTLER